MATGRRDLSWLPFAGGAAIAAIVLIVAFTTGSSPSPPSGGSSSVRAAVIAYLRANANGHPDSDAATCPDQRGQASAGWTFVGRMPAPGEPIDVHLDADGKHATVIDALSGNYRVRIEQVSGEYYACPPD